MLKRVVLDDVDRPREPLEAEVQRIDELAMRLIVPNTRVEFELRRLDPGALFMGSLGRRDYVFDPGDSGE